jgi:hypothetical protein
MSDDRVLTEEEEERYEGAMGCAALLASHRLLREERDRLLHTSDKQAAAWKARALKAEAACGAALKEGEQP